MEAQAVSGAGVVAERAGTIARLRLTRVKALNALDLPMIRILRARLDEWADDPSVSAVILTGEGRAFCAGGDVRMVREQVLAGAFDAAEQFFIEEYALNGAIARFPKPYISLIDGICMCGGLGVSVHGSHRIVTEAASLAMPETAIGLTPDIGASFFLPRLPGALGSYMALTGAIMVGADAVHAGLATAFVPRARLDALTAALVAEGPAALDRFAEPLPPFSLAPHRALIDGAFSADSLAEIEARLEASGSAFAVETLAVLRRMSPSSLCWSLASLRAGAKRDLDACLAGELRLVRRILRLPDFAEGVRAMLVDKDRKPIWRPARLEDVDPRAIADLVHGVG